mgnify:FL=1
MKRLMIFMAMPAPAFRLCFRKSPLFARHTPEPISTTNLKTWVFLKTTTMNC